jgi:hypothetical protein
LRLTERIKTKYRGPSPFDYAQGQDDDFKESLGYIHLEFALVVGRRGYRGGCGVGVGIGGVGVGVGVGDDFAAAADEDLLLALVVEVYVEDGGAAMVPDLFGDGEVEEDHALGGLAWADHRIAQEGFGGEGLEGGEGGVDVLEVELFDCAGGDFFAFRGGEGGGEVFEEEGKVEAVIDSQGGEDVEGVFGVLIGDHDGVGFEDGVGGVDGGADDGEVSGSMRGEAEEESENDPENQEREEYGCQQVASSGLSELEVGHLDEHSKAEVLSGRLKQEKLQ